MAIFAADFIIQYCSPMNDLEKYFRTNGQRHISKWIHYFDVYDRHFSKYRDKEIVVLEIGVFQGGSLQMWKNYFGPKAKIYGIDINPDCKKFEEENIEIFIRKLLMIALLLYISYSTHYTFNNLVWTKSKRALIGG